MEQITIMSEFAKDTLKGLSARDKHLSSKYFYDTRGSILFQDIMQMPEYYLTDCELEIFENNKQEIFRAFAEDDKYFEVIELGAGDGFKTKVLLSHFQNQKTNFEYIPIDISEDSIKHLVIDLERNLPNLKTDGKVGDYFQLMEEINRHDATKKIILFLGSNIGNFNESETVIFMNKLKSVMHSRDMLFIGFDLKKSPDVILKAYDDPHGYTAAFNLNFLQRINEELNGNFDLQNFKHHEIYNPISGTAKSHLISLKKHDVEIYDLNKTFSFEKGESIFMEMSQKYDQEMINDIAEKSGFQVVDNFYDHRNYFVNSLWKIA
jgi:L-histidine N-alpha-methyltransferase